MLISWHPPSSQSFVELDNRYQMQTLRCAQSRFNIKQIALGKQHIDIAGNPTLVPQVSDTQC